MKNTDNKLIAEFMGCTNPFNEIHDATLYKVEQGTFELDELQYNISWDWLMPVVCRIDDLFDDDDDINDQINEVHNAVLQFDREILHRAVVEFITKK